MIQFSCLVCEKDIRFLDILNAPDLNAPNEAVICSTRGNYGSTKLDLDIFERGNEYCEFLICDDCLVKKQDLISFVKLVKASEAEWERKPFRTYLDAKGENIFINKGESDEEN